MASPPLLQILEIPGARSSRLTVEKIGKSTPQVCSGREIFRLAKQGRKDSIAVGGWILDFRFACRGNH